MIKAIPTLLHTALWDTQDNLRPQVLISSVTVDRLEYETFGHRVVAGVVRVLTGVLQGTRRTLLELYLQIQLDFQFCLFFNLFPSY